MAEEKRFVMIGVGGYIAPRHLQAISATGNQLTAALDPSDSVGIIDRYFPEADFFTEFERFDRHVDKKRREGESIDYVSICSPNYLHDAHIRFALRSGAHAVCEKPLVLNPWHIDRLQEIERETGKNIFPILQLRVHPTIRNLRDRFREPQGKIDIDLSYVTPRGKWYFYSWKADEAKSGGVGTNIGIHFFDMLIWIFGEVKQSAVYLREPKKMSGYLELEHARVRWFLSVDVADLPRDKKEAYMPHRSISIEGEELEFSQGFTDLHTVMYEKILAGDSFGIEDARPAIQLAHDLRTGPVSEPIGNTAHPLLRRLLHG